MLRQTGDMERLLQGRQSGIAYDISMNTEPGTPERGCQTLAFP
ncbi:DUF4099 domain-containing protein [Bacteroides thetaiotaomicron]|nr:DUF4099 domain-containing protein [Bacteroides thetaiotaomicron]